MIHPDFQIVKDHFGDHRCCFNVETRGNKAAFLCEIDQRDIDEGLYFFSSDTPEGLLCLIAEQFSSSDESFDGEHAYYETWCNIPGLDAYFTKTEKVI